MGLQRPAPWDLQSEYTRLKKVLKFIDEKGLTGELWSYLHTNHSTKREGVMDGDSMTNNIQVHLTPGSVLVSAVFATDAAQRLNEYHSKLKAGYDALDDDVKHADSASGIGATLGMELQNLWPICHTMMMAAENPTVLSVEEMRQVSKWLQFAKDVA